MAQELSQLGAQSIVERAVGVTFEGPLGLAYRACLWSRMANRIVLELGSWPAQSADELYEVARTIRWTEQVSANSSLMVDFSGRSADIRNEQFGARRIKDAIVDQFREAGLSRPTVSVKEPDLRIVARLSKGSLSIGLDLSGESLHRRGYRLSAWKRVGKKYWLRRFGSVEPQMYTQHKGSRA